MVSCCCLLLDAAVTASAPDEPQFISPAVERSIDLKALKMPDAAGPALVETATHVAPQNAMHSSC